MMPQTKGILPNRPRIVFMGTPEFARPSLKGLISSGHTIAAVVTQPDRRSGRGRKRVYSPIKQMALDHRLPILQPQRASDENFYRQIREKAPDLIIVVAFGQILKKQFLDMPTWGVLNIHASLLPQLRGAAPIQYAILKNAATTGLTAMRMDEGLDTGPILLQEEVRIGPDETAGELHDKLAELSESFLLKTLEELMANRIKETPQDDERATYSSKIDTRMTRIRWDQSAETLSALIRAFDPWPGAVAKFKDTKIKLFSSRIVDYDHQSLAPGKVLGFRNNGLEVSTGKGIIRIGQMQISGKRRLPAGDFLRGFALPTGALLK